MCTQLNVLLLSGYRTGMLRLAKHHENVRMKSADLFLVASLLWNNSLLYPNSSWSISTDEHYPQHCRLACRQQGNFLLNTSLWQIWGCRGFSMQDGKSEAGTGFESLPFKLEHLVSCCPRKCNAIFQSKYSCSVVSTVYMLENPGFYFLITCPLPNSCSDLMFGQEHPGNLQWHLAGPSHVPGLGSCLCMFNLCPMHRLPFTHETWSKQRSDPPLSASQGKAVLRHPVLMLITHLWSSCLSTAPTIFSLSSSRLPRKPCTAAKEHERSATSKQITNLKSWLGFSEGNWEGLRFPPAKSVPVCVLSSWLHCCLVWTCK